MRTERQRGFTLVEAVITIVLTGIVIAVVAIFIVPATTAYFAAATRAQLVDQADTALRRIARDLSGALPNSVRLQGNSLELIPASAAARYAVDGSNALQFGVVPGSFGIVGPALRLSQANQPLAWYNLGAGVPDADAYSQANVRLTSNAAGNATTVTLSGAALPTPLMAPPFRVYALESPVTYRCDTSTTPGTLMRYTGYGFLATQADPPSGGTAAVMARQVAACSFNYNPAAVAGRYALVTLQLSLQAQGETISLYHAVHVDNLP